MEMITKLICEKNKISYVVFDKKFLIKDFNSSLELIVDEPDNLKQATDIREVMWEFVGLENRMEELYSGLESVIHFPMIKKDENYYDLDVETYINEENERVFIAYLIQKPKESLGYINMIKEINRRTLILESDDKKNQEEHYNLINKKLLSFNVDMDGIITLSNDAFSYFFDLSSDQILGKHFSYFFKARDLTLHGNTSIIFNAINQKEEIISFHANIIPLAKEGITYENIIICQDVTYLKRIEKELVFAASHDSLTGLANRSQLLKKMDRSITKRNGVLGNFSICCIDLDKFKPVNDNYGHHAGDMLLKHIAKVLTDFVRKKDMVARIGGDEFVIFFDSLSEKKSLCKMIERIEELPSKKPFIYSEEDIIEFSFSLGVASFPRDAKDSQTLLNVADKAMYMSKKSEH
ncbi:diguanylate cyclase [Sulfurimonas aquatica]|uniref:Diguanylate cyclase n=1 Tax=Sulfurimonas aquatica TaxID=2672570 RepID=A0A975GCK7_9BACT|nr:sensor domain-containing diguanylate cyclase [Sulfurimonas aquatica]QSZ41379.1 diguanylate cyclase [Sulfurimonas aquatica]